MAEPRGEEPDQADETLPFVDKGRVEIVKLAGGTVGRGTFEPGWRWSEHVKPIAGTESCQAAHMGYCVSGRMVVQMDDGTERRSARATSRRSPGHDAWVVGDEPASRWTSPAWRPTPRRASAA